MALSSRRNTMANLLKKEADASSSQPSLFFVGRNKIKALKAKKDANVEAIVDECLQAFEEAFGPHDLESEIAWSLSEKDVNATKFDVILIESGLGNFSNCAYYPNECLKASAGVFEGKKIYANHPSQSEENDRPERSVKDILGHFENVRYQETNGRGVLRATLVVTPGESLDWAKQQFLHAIKFKESHPDQEFIGLSINAEGDFEERDIEHIIATAPPDCIPKLMTAKEKGIYQVNYVQKIENATSCDLVTEAGAGGKILKLLEEDLKMSKKIVKEADDASKDKDLMTKMVKKHMGDEVDEATMEAVGKTSAAYEAIGMDKEAAVRCASAHHTVEGFKAKKEAMDKADKEKEAAAKKDAGGDDGDADDKKDKKESEVIEQDATKKLQETEVVKLQGRIAALETENRTFKLNKLVEKTLAESKLPRSATDLFRKQIVDVKTESEFTKLFAAFKEGFGAKVVSDEDENPFVISVEKLDLSESEQGDIDLSDCIEN
jgi:hypothetical protein